MKKAIFPGSFDPFTLGHEDIVLRALSVFDQVIVAIGSNTRKQGLLPIEKRKEWVERVFEKEKRVTCQVYSGMTIDFCHEQHVGFIIRGLRSGADFDYEQVIAQLNQSMDNQIETIFLASRPHLSHISSTIVREILIHKGSATAFLPAAIADEIQAYTENR